MIKEMKGWKVISYGRYSARSVEWVHYPVNEEVKPSITGSKLFFFRKKEDADKFCAYCEMIVPCIAKNVTKPVYAMSSGDMRKFWENINKCPNRYIREVRNNCYYHILLLPQGTYWAESITCLK